MGRGGADGGGQVNRPGLPDERGRPDRATAAGDGPRSTAGFAGADAGDGEQLRAERLSRTGVGGGGGATGWVGAGGRRFGGPGGHRLVVPLRLVRNGIRLSRIR
jgi:hypothetical protein